MNKVVGVALLAALVLSPAFADPSAPARKTWRDPVVGHHVPAGAVRAVPLHVRATLPRPPRGCRYAVVNDKVVLMSDANIVVDVIRDIMG
jgi:hypothetical protein